jgi:hypothetical protein
LRIFICNAPPISTTSAQGAGIRTSGRCRGPRPPHRTTAESQYADLFSMSLSTCLVEQLDAANLVGDLLGEHGVPGRALDLDFSVRHGCGVGGGGKGRKLSLVRGVVAGK